MPGVGAARLSGRVWRELLQDDVSQTGSELSTGRGLGSKGDLALGESISELTPHHLFHVILPGKEFCELLCFLKP